MPEKIDLRGLTCPEPVIKTKKLFDNPTTGTVEALVDDMICVNNLKRLAGSLKASFAFEEQDSHFLVSISREAAGAAAVQPDRALERRPQTGTIIFLSKDTLGDGDPELSRMLVNLFLQTVLDSGLSPRAILLANSGVKLLAIDSPVLKVLQDFREAGCEVLACGLCLDFYKLKDQVDSAQVTNMFAICEYLFAAERVIQP